MKPVIILVKPQLAENIGMVARAMKNCTLTELRIVSPEQSPTDIIALRASSGSEEILTNSKIYSTTQEAIADLELVYSATARPRHQVKQVMTAEYMAQNYPYNLKVGFMFGCERTGLENDDISLSDAIVEVPLNPEHSSLNLAQAVLILSYEYYKTTLTSPHTTFQTNGGEIASKEKLLKFLTTLDDHIKKSPRLKNTDHTESLIRNINNIFTRSQLTTQELNSLYGVINILKDTPK
ncbi:MAG: RNA methyltransferase [Alphaproteobacteria bacterium]|nr:RNA methyltransferase [Alphaproteobacteria bacterium]